MSKHFRESFSGWLALGVFFVASGVVAAYFLWPSDAAFWVGGILAWLAFGLLAGTVQELKETSQTARALCRIVSRHSRLLWAATIVLALGGNLLYLLGPDDLSWWLGGLAAMPLAFLITAWIAAHEERTGKGPTGGGGDWGGGPFAPP